MTIEQDAAIGTKVVLTKEAARGAGIPPEMIVTVAAVKQVGSRTFHEFDMGKVDVGFAARRWFEHTDGRPAPSPVPASLLPLHGVKTVPDDPLSTSKGTHMSAAQQTPEARIIALGERIAKERGILPREGYILAGKQLKDTAVKAYHLSTPVIDGVPAPESPADGLALLRAATEEIIRTRGVSAKDAVQIALAERFGAAPTSSDAGMLSLSAKPGEDFDTFCMRIHAEQSIPLAEAVHACGRARPDLAAAR